MKGKPNAVNITDWKGKYTILMYDSNTMCIVAILWKPLTLQGVGRMQRITWNDELRLGIGFIDDHHKKMINIANEFINATNQGSKPKVLSQLLVKLREHAVSHLKDEERIMASVRYRNRSIHSLENERLKVAMKGFHRHLRTTEKITVRDIQFLKQSLISHITNSNEVVTRIMLSNPLARA